MNYITDTNTIMNIPAHTDAAYDDYTLTLIYGITKQEYTFTVSNTSTGTYYTFDLSDVSTLPDGEYTYTLSNGTTTLETGLVWKGNTTADTIYTTNMTDTVYEG